MEKRASKKRFVEQKQKRKKKEKIEEEALERVDRQEEPEVALEIDSF